MGRKKEKRELRTHLEIAIIHTPKHAMLPQPLRRNPGTRNPKRDSSQESRVVPDVRGSQYGLDFLLVDASFSRKIVTRLEELDRGIRKTEVAMSATVRWHGVLVAEMSRQFTTGAAGVGD